ncbi:hypothetical protein F5877DRAFT_73099, partial [Lentinula edodes]
THHNADAISTVSGLKETRAVHERVSRGVNDVARGAKPLRADHFPDRSRQAFILSQGGCRRRVFHPSQVSIFCLLTAVLLYICEFLEPLRRFDQSLGVDPQQFWLLLNPPGSAQLTWPLDNPPGFWTIQLALSTVPEQNHAPKIGGGWARRSLRVRGPTRHALESWSYQQLPKKASRVGQTVSVSRPCVATSHSGPAKEAGRVARPSPIGDRLPG